MENKDVKMLIDLDKKHDLGLCHGLAPNPFGFTFHRTGNLRVDKLAARLLTDIELSDEATKELLNYMRGH